MCRIVDGGEVKDMVSGARWVSKLARGFPGPAAAVELKLGMGPLAVRHVAQTASGRVR